MTTPTDDAHKLYRLVNRVKAWCARYPHHSLSNVTYDPEKQAYTITVAVQYSVSVNKSVEDMLEDADQINLMLDYWFDKPVEGKEGA